MSGSKKPNTSAEFDDEFFPPDGSYFFNDNNGSPQSQIQHDFSSSFMMSETSPSALLPVSPLMSSYSQHPNSAPITYPITHSNSSWPSKDMISQCTRNHSFHEGHETDILHGIDIPGAQASSHHRIMMSPDESFHEAYSMRYVHSHESSFDNGMESFPLLDDPIMYSSSPNTFDLSIGSGSWGSHMTSAKPRNRTESVLSYGSILSNEADMINSEYPEEIFSTNLEFGEVEPTKPSLPIPAIRRVGKATVTAAIKKGRKGALSTADREKIAYIRKIKACQACKIRKLAVSCV
jgi:hypothetical protein